MGPRCLSKFGLTSHGREMMFSSKGRVSVNLPRNSQPWTAMCMQRKSVFHEKFMESSMGEFVFRARCPTMAIIRRHA